LGRGEKTNSVHHPLGNNRKKDRGDPGHTFWSFLGGFHGGQGGGTVRPKGGQLGRCRESCSVPVRIDGEPSSLG